MVFDRILLGLGIYVLIVLHWQISMKRSFYYHPVDDAESQFFKLCEIPSLTSASVVNVSIATYSGDVRGWGLFCPLSKANSDLHGVPTHMPQLGISHRGK